MTEDRTIYTVVDEVGIKTTITLDKWVADILQNHLPDVHRWVQKMYDKVASEKPRLGRRLKGDLVRAISVKEALSSPAGIVFTEDF